MASLNPKLALALLKELRLKPYRHKRELWRAVRTKFSTRSRLLTVSDVNRCLLDLKKGRKVDFKIVMDHGRKAWFPSGLTAKRAIAFRQKAEATIRSRRMDWPLARVEGNLKRRRVVDPTIQPPVELHHWQRKAFRRWQKLNRRGVIEAATGSGKTRVGCLAIAEELRAGGAALILVPTRILADQWQIGIKKELHVESERFVPCKGTSKVVLRPGQICIAVVNSARNSRFRLPAAGGLLVADEVHRCATRENSRAMKKEFSRRFGLSATIEREDGEHVSMLKPYFESFAYRFDLKDAIKAGVVAKPAIAVMAVNWETALEEKRYRQAVKTYANARARLIDEFGAPDGSFSALAQQAGAWEKDGSHWDRQKIASEFGKAFRQARQLLANTKSKLKALELIGRETKRQSRVLIFTETTTAASRAASTYRKASDAIVKQVDGNTPTAIRRDVLDRFQTDDVSVLVAPKVLDEGVDLPSAGLGVIVASARSRRQLIQRIGRVVRLDQGKDSARVMILYVKDTGEDPFSRYQHVVADLLSEIATVSDHPIRLEISDRVELQRFLGPLAKRRAQ